MSPHGTATRARGNYALMSSSPCIDTGMLLSWMTDGATDLVGAPVSSARPRIWAATSA